MEPGAAGSRSSSRRRGVIRVACQSRPSCWRRLACQSARVSTLSDPTESLIRCKRASVIETPSQSVAYALDRTLCDSDASRSALDSPALEARRARGRDKPRLLLAEIAKTVRKTAVEIVGFSGLQHTALISDGYLELARQHHAGLLGLMAKHHLSGIGAGRIAFHQHLQCLATQVAPDLAVADLATRDLDQFVGGKENLRTRGTLQGEELRQTEGESREHLLQQANRGAACIALDQGDHGIGDSRPLCQLTLRKTMQLAQGAKP